MQKQFMTQEFKRELQLFFEKNHREILKILQLIPDLDFRSYPIALGKELMNIFGDFLEKYTAPSLDSVSKSQEKEVFKSSGDRSMIFKIDKKNESTQNSENLWQYQSISDCQPDNHRETYCQHKLVEDGLQIIGASVRGKSHKHKGTNRDDWFEFATVNNWQIIAVADGAGSKMFSRLGAKISCQTAVENLAQSLAEHDLKPRSDRQDLRSSDRDIALVYQSIEEAISAAYQAVVSKVKELEDSVTYYQPLGNRKLELSDLAATLLIAIRTTIVINDEEYSFVFSHQIGDGVIAVISQEYRLEILGIPETGNYAGQTNFLTSRDRRDNNFNRDNIKTFLGKLKTLMIMSDGVSDDYFPNYPKIANLYGDLVLNHILPVAEIKPPEYSSEQEADILKTEIEIQKNYADFCSRHQVLTAEGVNNFPVAYLEKFAQLLRIEESKLIASPLLAMGAKANPVREINRSQNNTCPAARLRNWLDAYYRRGSFDDRTLVILYQQ